MPRTQLIFYKQRDGAVPVRDWLLELKRRERRVFAKCVVRLRRLADAGHELRRPEADFLRDGIYELRVREGRRNFRILYFFHGRNVAILAQGLMKEAEVPRAEIERALGRKAQFEAKPAAHSHEEDLNG